MTRRDSHNYNSVRKTGKTKTFVLQCACRKFVKFSPWTAWEWLFDNENNLWLITPVSGSYAPKSTITQWLQIFPGNYPSSFALPNILILLYSKNRSLGCVINGHFCFYVYRLVYRLRKMTSIVYGDWNVTVVPKIWGMLVILDHLTFLVVKWQVGQTWH